VNRTNRPATPAPSGFIRGKVKEAASDVVFLMAGGGAHKLVDSPGEATDTGGGKQGGKGPPRGVIGPAALEKSKREDGLAWMKIEMPSGPSGRPERRSTAPALEEVGEAVIWRR